MTTFKLVITGDVPNGKAQELHESIPDLVRGMRSFGVTVSGATTYPGGITHHNHADSLDVGDGNATATRLNADVGEYAQALENELAKLATYIIDRFPGEHPNDGTSIVDTAIAVLGRAADVRAQLAAVSKPLIAAEVIPFGEAYVLDVVKDTELAVGDIVLALNGVIWHRPRKLDAIDRAPGAIVITYMTEIGQSITTPYAREGLWFVARHQHRPTAKPDGSFDFGDLGDAIASAGKTETIRNISGETLATVVDEGHDDIVTPGVTSFESVTPPAK